jgi:hypothetical protein
MAKYIKNNDSVSRTWCGMEVVAGAYYLIQSSEQFRWANDSSVFDSIADDTLIVSKTNDSSGHITDHSDALNYLKDESVEIDDQGRQIIRTAAASKGWTYLADSMEIETSNLTGLYAKDYLGNNNSAITVKFYDASGTELTTQGTIDTDCVKTEMLFKPSYDYEVVGGNIHHGNTPSSDVRMWVVGGLIELGGAYVKEMVRGMNLKNLGTDDHIETDGRAAKYMKKDISGVPYQGNQLKFIFKHDAGFKHKVMIVLEYFRA